MTYYRYFIYLDVATRYMDGLIDKGFDVTLERLDVRVGVCNYQVSFK